MLVLTKIVLSKNNFINTPFSFFFLLPNRRPFIIGCLVMSVGCHSIAYLWPLLDICPLQFSAYYLPPSYQYACSIIFFVPDIQLLKFFMLRVLPRFSLLSLSYFFFLQFYAQSSFSLSQTIILFLQYLVKILRCT